MWRDIIMSQRWLQRSATLPRCHASHSPRVQRTIFTQGYSQKVVHFEGLDRILSHLYALRITRGPSTISADKMLWSQASATTPHPQMYISMIVHCYVGSQPIPTFPPIPDTRSPRKRVATSTDISTHRKPHLSIVMPSSSV